MSAVLTGRLAVAPTRDVVPALARREARRLVLHPVALVGLGLAVLASGGFVVGGNDPVPAFEAVTFSPSLFPGIPMILAGHMVATRDGRAGALDLLGGVPARAEERVRALCLAALAPALIASTLSGGLFLLLLARGDFADVPSAAQLLIPPSTVLGGTLLGVMVGVWSPPLVSPVLAIVAMVGLHLAVAGDAALRLLAPAAAWADWGLYDGSVWIGQLPGSPGWHLAYVLGLSALAVTGALLRVSERRAPVIGVGLVTLAATVAAGVLQLP